MTFYSRLLLATIYFGSWIPKHKLKFEIWSLIKPFKKKIISIESDPKYQHRIHVYSAIYTWAPAYLVHMSWNENGVKHIQSGGRSDHVSCDKCGHASSRKTNHVINHVTSHVTKHVISLSICIYRLIATRVFCRFLLFHSTFPTRFQTRRWSVTRSIPVKQPQTGRPFQLGLLCTSDTVERRIIREMERRHAAREGTEHFSAETGENPFLLSVGSLINAMPTRTELGRTEFEQTKLRQTNYTMSNRTRLNQINSFEPNSSGLDSAVTEPNWLETILNPSEFNSEEFRIQISGIHNCTHATFGTEPLKHLNMSIPSLYVLW